MYTLTICWTFRASSKENPRLKMVQAHVMRGIGLKYHSRDCEPSCTWFTKPMAFNLTLQLKEKVSLVMRKPDFCICENKDADQLRGNREADQRLCFRYTDITILLLSKSEISSLLPSYVTVQPGLCGTWSETPKTGFIRTRLKLVRHSSPADCFEIFQTFIR